MIHLPTYIDYSFLCSLLMVENKKIVKGQTDKVSYKADIQWSFERKGKNE